MSRIQKEVNLRGLFESLEQYARDNGGDSPERGARLSDSLFLSHSTSVGRLSSISANGYLASARRISAEGGKAPGPTEIEMGTDDSVFFFLAPFRYPGTSCGLLLAKTLESFHEEDGSASPFDSGALRSNANRPDMSEPPRDFLLRYELPIPEHLNYLALAMNSLFRRPEDYVENVDPYRGGPIGLSRGDSRRWTHEVRIPNRGLRGIVWVKSADFEPARCLPDAPGKGPGRNPRPRDSAMILECNSD